MIVMRRSHEWKSSHGDCRRSRSKEEELELRRREWAKEQQRLREHEQRKQKMIQEYEERRARELSKKKHTRRSPHRSYSKSRSRSSEVIIKKPTESEKNNSSKSFTMSERFDAPSSSNRVFKGPEGSKIPVAELKKIKVDIHRKLATIEETTELNRDILHPEEVQLKRREGEGNKPIFEREELKKPRIKSTEVEERRTIVVTDIERPHSSRKRSSSSSPRRHHRSRSPHRDLRHETGSRSRGEKSDHRDHSRKYSRDRSREYRDRSSPMKSTRTSRRSSQDRDRDHRRRRSSSVERHERYRSSRDLTPYDRRDSRSRRYEDERIRSRIVPLPHPYIESMPVPFYYGNFARPFIVDPMMALRGPIPMSRGRIPPIMGTIRPPFIPRFMPPEMFRPSGPQNPRFNRMM